MFLMEIPGSLFDAISAIGALLVGVAAITTSLFSLHRAKKHAEDICTERIAEMKASFVAGTRYEPRHRHPHSER